MAYVDGRQIQVYLILFCWFCGRKVILLRERWVSNFATSQASCFKFRNSIRLDTYLKIHFIYAF